MRRSGPVTSDDNRKDALRKATRKKEMLMKKIASVFAIGVMAASLFACAKPEEKPAPKAEAPKVVEEKPATTAAAPGTPATGAPAPAAPAPGTPATK
jgi:hypothetical protein